MTRHLHIVTPWDDPESFRDEVAYYESVARAIAASQHRATRHSPSPVSRSRLSERVSAIAWNDLLFGAACGLIAGMLATVGLAYAVGLFL